MPYQFQFDSNLRILLVVFEGEFRGEIPEAANEIKPHFDDLRLSAVIADFTAVTSFDVAGDLIRLQSKIDVAMVRNTPFALVVPQQYMFGLARMYELSSDPPFPRLQIVRSREEALAALKVADPKFDRLVLPSTEN